MSGLERETPPAGDQGRGEDSAHDPCKITPSIPGIDGPGEGEGLLPSKDAVREALRLIHPEGPWHVSAKREKGFAGKVYAPDAEGGAAGWAMAQNRTLNAYVSIAALRPGWNGDKATKADVASVGWLWVDVDPRPGEELEAERSRILANLTTNLPKGVPPPSAIIDSGRGFWGLWRLSQPVVMPPADDPAWDAARAVVEDRNRGLELAFGADACHNLERICRLPGTVNRKPGGRLARVVRADASVFDLTAFPAVPDPKAGAAVAVAGRATVTAAPAMGLNLDDLPAGVSDRIRAMIVQGNDPDDPGRYGSRSEAFWAVICAMVRAGCTDEQMLGVSLDRDYKISGHVLDQPKPESYARKQIAKARDEATDPELAELNALHAFVTYGNKGRVLFEQAGRPPLFLEKQTFLDMYANRVKVVGRDSNGKDIMMPLGKWWFQKAERRQFKGVEFLPGQDAPDGTFNLWRGPAVVPKAGDCSLYLALVRDVIAAGDNVVSEYLLNWMALKLQKPGEKVETSIALRGGQGLGKSVFAENFGSLFGPYFVAVSELKQLTGNFNAHLQHALLVFGDEMAASNNPHLVGRMKTMVTQKHIRIEPKGVDSFDASNHFALILASNNPHIVTTDADDRRYLVLDVAAVRKNDLTFFRALDAQWRAGGREAFAAFLMARDLSGFEHRRKPRTSGDTDLVEISFAGAERVVHDMLRSGETATVWRDGVPHSTLYDGKTGEVFLNSGDVAQWAQRRGRWTPDERSIGRLLKKLAGAEDEDAPRESVHGKQVRGSWLPPLPEARRRWCAMHGRDFDWGEGDGACWDVVGMPATKPQGQDEPPF